MTNDIVIRGAREHNLKNLDLTIPRDKLVVITGLSGSGKSSLAFDTIYAEGQRRYVESLSSYARQFLGQMKKPEVEHIEGLSPAISIDQKSVHRNPRSTVGTVTEIYDYLRLLFAHIGTPHCPECGEKIQKQSAEEIVHQIQKLPKGTRLQILAPVVREKKGEYKKLFEDLRAKGFVRVRVNGEVGDVDGKWSLGRYEKTTIEAVVDRLVSGESEASRLTEAVEQALRLGEGIVTVNVAPEGGKAHDLTFSENFACPTHGATMPELAPRIFSFNSPQGACETCDGLGFKLEIDVDLIIKDPNATLRSGLFHRDVSHFNTWMTTTLREVGKSYGFNVDTPWNKLSREARNTILYGTGGEKVKMTFKGETEKSSYNWSGYWDFEGVATRLERLFKESESQVVKDRIAQFLSTKPCTSCKGRRLRPSSLGVTIAGKSVIDVTELPVGQCLDWFDKLEGALNVRERKIAHEVVKEIRERLTFMRNVGLEYLTLSRTSGTLSGGEAQRIRLATQIGSGLVGVLYILDEPSIGLHQKDNAKLLHSLERLRDLGNTLLIVEHDEETMESADWIIDLGPGAGEHGGRLVAQGTVADLKKHPESVTGKYLSGRMSIPIPAKRRNGSGHKLVLRGAAENNLQEINVEIPLGRFVCVTGVSGSGKSTLVNDILYKALAQRLHGAHEKPGKFERLEGTEHTDKVIIIDQSPIGRTPRSNPATYTGLFTPIRELMAMTPAAKGRGYKAGRFSFNVHGGRCESCEGDGVTKIEMHFLPDVYVPCEVCKGARYNRETLLVEYNGKNIKAILDMSVEEALAFFQNIPSIRNKLQTLFDVGLGYIKLGQPATTLSGGEAQRVKLATELSKRATGKTFYILDEPTTGLHFHDVRSLLGVLGRLVDTGNTVLVIEHNLDVVKTADWIIDLGPEGGDKGGRVVAVGTPEDVARSNTHTGYYLKRVLLRGEREAVPMTVPARRAGSRRGLAQTV
ncbi:MAG TPA: excinuclease ABC subunit UvrA [Candidatus Thermoplasmatota archaeon]|nr:excinuclease ABC subunit UvrA [Candidatus Thermoplasmatota archaeon]